MGPNALLERMGALSPLDDWTPSGFDYNAPKDYLERLITDAVGGVEAMASLDEAPLPDEPLSLDGVPTDIRDRVAAISTAADALAIELFSPELRTAARRILTRIASGDPAIFRRRPSDEGAVAALLWIAGSANQAFGISGGRTTVSALQQRIGVTSHPGPRARPMLRALGVEYPEDWSVNASLGDPSLLTSQRRAALLRIWKSFEEE